MKQKIMTKPIYQQFTPNGLEKIQDLTNSSRLIIKEAEIHGIKWKIIPGTQIITLNYKGKEKFYHHQVPSTTAALATYCDDKMITRNLLKNANISIANGYMINRDSNEKYKRSVFDSLKKPLAVKPSNGIYGKSISLGIDNYEKYLNAINLAFSYSTSTKGVIVEEMFEGEEYRILATREKVIGILNRIPANVIGNSKNTIEELILEKNKEDIRTTTTGNKSHELIAIDTKLKQYLTEQNLKLDTILENEKRVFLRKVSNVTQGGEAIDYTDKAHQSVKDLAIKTVRAIPGLSFAGVDFMSKDITKEQTKDSYVIIETNESPGFGMHSRPYKGKDRRGGREFLLLMFPELKMTDIG